MSLLLFIFSVLGLVAKEVGEDMILHLNRDSPIKFPNLTCSYLKVFEMIGHNFSLLLSLSDLEFLLVVLVACVILCSQQQVFQV